MNKDLQNSTPDTAQQVVDAAISFDTSVAEGMPRFDDAQDAAPWDGAAGGAGETAVADAATAEEADEVPYVNAAQALKAIEAFAVPDGDMEAEAEGALQPGPEATFSAASAHPESDIVNPIADHAPPSAPLSPADRASRDALMAAYAASEAKKASGTPREPVRREARPKGFLRRVVVPFVAILLTLVLSLLTLAMGVLLVVFKGPSPTAAEQLVVSANETSALKFLPHLFYSEAEVQRILAANVVVPPDEVTDPTIPFAPAQGSAAHDDIEIVDVTGPTFKGKMMIVYDPSRVRLVTLDTYGPEVRGKRIEDFVADTGAIAGINAGGFVDLDGVGKGGEPLGLLICDGVIRSGAPSTTCNVIGFDYDNHLIVGMMSGAEALARNIRDAVYFEPTLIVNGKPADFSSDGGGLNPRTVIGQRADGAVLLLVIDGRQPHSIGATLQDCMDVMLEFGAINAANLDGGSSSMMVYDGEVINVCASLYGSRAQPAAFVVY